MVFIRCIRGLIVFALGLGMVELYAQTTVRPITRQAPRTLPDPTLFDGSKYPEETRPTRGIVATITAGSEEPMENPSEQGGGGAEGSEGDENGGGGGGGQQGDPAELAEAGGEEIPVEEEGAAGSEGQDQSIPEMADAGGQEGEDGEGAMGGPQDAPDGDIEGETQAAMASASERPSDVTLGDPSQQIQVTSIAGDRPSPVGADEDPAEGEERMQIDAAQGRQLPERSRGAEEGLVMPSDL